MANYIKAIVAVATATTAETFIIIPADNVTMAKSSADTSIEVTYGQGDGAGASLTFTLTLAGGAGTSAGSNQAAIRDAIIEATSNPGSVPYLFPVGINGAAPINLATAHAVSWV